MAIDHTVVLLAIMAVTYVTACFFFARNSSHDANVAPGVDTDPDAGPYIDY